MEQQPFDDNMAILRIVNENGTRRYFYHPEDQIGARAPVAPEQDISVRLRRSDGSELVGVPYTDGINYRVDFITGPRAEDIQTVTITPEESAAWGLALPRPQVATPPALVPRPAALRSSVYQENWVPAEQIEPRRKSGSWPRRAGRTVSNLLFMDGEEGV